MSIDLLHRIESRSASVVVVGLGYVGLPVACSFARQGFQVVGLDVYDEKIALINEGRSPIEGKEPGLDDLLAEVVREGRLRATNDYSACRTADVVLFSVETPVDRESKRPRYTALRSALTSLGSHLQVGTMVIVESTIAPRTMLEVVQPLLEETSGLRAGEDFLLVHCPERLTPRRLLHNLTSMPRVVGGTTSEASDLAIALYRTIVNADLSPTDCLTAELVKTAENAYRDVQIAFANELALTCEAIGGDVWKVREFMNKLPGREMLLPGAGVGGHCIPKDPWLLVTAARDRGYWPTVIPTSRAINDSMPLHVAELTLNALDKAGRSPEGAHVTILGYAYLENSDDTRNSPSQTLACRLRELGVDVVIHDPFVSRLNGSIESAVRRSDCVVLMVKHDLYRDLDWSALREVVRTPLVVDGRNLLGDDETCTDAGFVRVTLGIATGLGEGIEEARSTMSDRLVPAIG